LFDQPCGGQVEQRDRSLRTDPGSSVEPPDKTKVFRLLMKISVAVSALNLSGMRVVGFDSFPIEGQTEAEERDGTG
jgi:hypothetical protein